MKRAIIFLFSLFLVLLLACQPQPASAAEIVASGKCGDGGTWTFDSDGVLTISGSTGNYYFYNHDHPWADIRASVESVVIEEGVKRIGEGAFADHSNLIRVKLPASLEEIGYNAFYDCENMTEVHLASMESWLKLSFPYEYETVSGDPFKENDKAKKIYLNGVEIEDLVIPAGVTEIRANAFRNCTSIRSVSIADGVTSIGYGAFYNCTDMNNVTIPGSVTNIGNYAFFGCSSLSTVTIPDSVLSIGASAFSGCSSLTNVKMSNSITSLPNTFVNCTALTSVNIPNGVIGLGGTFSGCTALTSVDLPNSVTGLNDTFSGCTALASVDLPNSVTILTGTFENCASLTQVSIPDSVTEIGNATFSGCRNLTSVSIPDSVLSIGASAFSGCSSLTTANIPNSVTCINYSMFADCTALVKFTVPDSVTEIYSDAFDSCTELTELTLGKGLETIQARAFQYCTSLPSLLIPGNVTSIHNESFYRCARLESVAFEEGVTDIWSSAFEYCSSLTSIVVPKSVSRIKNNAFLDCENLKDVYYAGTAKEWKPIAIKAGLPMDYRLHSGCTDPQGHWVEKASEATCTREKETWLVCNCGYEKDHQKISGSMLNHSWTNADCNTPYTCKVCKTTVGVAEDHKWIEATCCAPKTCVVCGTTVGQANKHSFVDGKCSVCGAGDPDFNNSAPSNDPVVPEEPTIPNAPVIPETVKITRLAGSTRYKTAFAAADELMDYAGIEKFDTIIVSSGEQFADALAGSYLAAAKNAPILLVKDSTVKAVKEYIQANLNPGGTVYLLGGKVAVPEKMETGLDGFNVKRLGGNTRYDTNLLILQEAGVAGKDIVVCTGKDFADSLSASAVGLPILLVKDSLNSAQKEFLSGNTGKIFVIGGVNAVSEKAEKQLAAYGNVTRLAGATRYKTSVLVAETFFGNPTAAVIAYGENFPDGLSGGPVAYALKSPLILTREGREKDAAAYITAKGITAGYILGGTTVLPEKTVNKVFGL